MAFAVHTLSSRMAPAHVRELAVLPRPAVLAPADPVYECPVVEIAGHAAVRVRVKDATAGDASVLRVAAPNDKDSIFRLEREMGFSPGQTSIRIDDRKLGPGYSYISGEI